MSSQPDHDVEAVVAARRRERSAPVAGATADAPAGRHLLGPGLPAWAATTAHGARGGQAIVRRSAGQLQGSAGNRAVSSLLTGGPLAPGASQRTGPSYRHAGESDVLGAEPTAEPAAEATAAGEGATPLGEGDSAPAPPPVPTSSFTKVGPPSPSTYTVSGTLRNAAETVGARKEAGATITTPDLVSADNGKRMVHAQVTVTQVVELPEWSDRPSATTNQKAEWDRFKVAITAHEAGHVATDVKSFAGAHGKILAKKTLQESNTEFGDIVDQAKADNDTFDTTTDHGRNTGTNINPNIDEVTKVP